MQADPGGKMKEARLLQLDPSDNVCVAIRTIDAGEILQTADGPAAAAQTIPLGFKVAWRAIRTGDRIRKYGAPIGSAVRDISAGEIVHLHNMKSDYLPTYTRHEGNKYGRT